MDQPLVSIVVITYNSSEYITEGLESAKSQTYKNIELIISDDCSTDNTVELCNKWLDENKHYFKRAEIITTEKNTGVAGNLNRGIRAAKGEWIKTLSGDDMFLPFTIQKYIEFAKNHPNEEIIWGKFLFFGNDTKYVDKIAPKYQKKFYPKMRLNYMQQYKENLKMLFVPSPGLIYKKSLLQNIGGFDERYPFCEEDPFMFNLYKLGKKVAFLNEVVYKYRVDENSLGRKDKGSLILTRHLKDRIKFFYDVRRKEMLKNKMFLYVYDETVTYNRIQSIGNNKFKTLLFSFLKLISPIYYKNLLKFKF